MKKNNITIIQPGGNDTALIAGIIPLDQRKKINDQVMQAYPTVEQVGFYTFDPLTNTAQLEMAGGEFCANATRSLAYFLLCGKDGSLKITVSGTTQSLIAGVRQGYAYTQIPFINTKGNIQKLGKNFWKVTLEGITHLVIYTDQIKVNKEILKQTAKQLLRENNLLDSQKAAGVMVVTEDFSLLPVVWVRDIQTLFVETACGSGTAAVALANQSIDNSPTKVVTLFQPSGIPITAKVERKNNDLQAEIYGTTVVKI